MLRIATISSACFGSLAHASDADEASRLLQAGKHAEATKIVENGLKRDPKDLQLRFMKGVLLAERKRSQEAIAVFEKLSEDYPELPEAHNNLAVLYSRDGQIDKAKAALDKAIKTNPGTAAAYENLGDLHARMAAQSYSKALNISSSAGTQPRLKMVTVLTLPKTMLATASPAPEAPKTMPAPAVPAPALAVAQAPATTVSKRTDPGKDETAVAGAAGAQSSPPVSAPAPVIASPSVPAPSASAPAPVAASPHDAINEAVDAWKKAWETKDMQGYVAAYAANFHSEDTKSHSQWVKLRRARILNKDSITISIERPVIRFDGETAVASFRQVYSGGKVRSDGMKTLTFQKKSGKWKITNEVSTD